MKYQERSLAQLWISHESRFSQEVLPIAKDKSRDSAILVPPNIPLVDSDALGGIIFDSEDSGSLPLSDIEQVLLIMSAYLSMQSRPKGDSLSDEFVLSTIQRLITDSSCKNSSIRSTVLIIRNIMEEDKGRYQERVLKQWEVISELYTQNQEPDASERLQYIFLLPFPPQVELQKMFAVFLGKMGLVKNAMEIFEKLQRWEELIECCCLIGHVSRAMSLIDERLSQELDIISKARLYCILGDLTRDEKHYRESWNISNRRFARAMRSLGKLYVKNHQWELAIDSFLEALAVNALYPDIWFLLGYCAQNKGDLNFAANAFTRVVQQEPDNGEAWNNLASVYVQLKKKKEALFALSQAVKHKRESWKIWENLLMVSLVVEGELGHSLNALEALVELRGRDGIYSEQLVTLVENVISEMVQENGNELLLRMCKRVLKLVGRISSMVSSDPNVWEASANLHHAAGYFEQEIADLQKQIRCLSGRVWWNDEKSLEKMLKATFRLNILCIDSGDTVSCYSSKLHTKKIIEKCKELELTNEAVQQLEHDLEALETKLSKLSD
ncbi:Tetratricopeptide repeat protein 27 [Galdieria sulphuraria]|nr:Tetratricopeptide repeat protein 27 [Galdieria sulphuraria]